MQKSADLVTIDCVTKSFNGNVVLDNFSAKITTGSIIGLIGKSGSGKSVLLNMLRGDPEYAPDSGKVIYHVRRCTRCGAVHIPTEGAPCPRCGGDTEIIDVDFWSLSKSDPLKADLVRGLAIMLQRSFALFGDLSVIENILEAIPENIKNRVERAIELLDFVNMSHRTMHIARDLSGGEKQRVVLARQLAHDPMLLIADEPTGTLDPYTAEIVHAKIVEYVKKTGIGMVFASHWPEALIKMADTGYLLEGGRCVMSGDPEKVTAKFLDGYKFERPKEIETGQPIISLKDVEKHYFSVSRGVVKAVDGISFDIAEREIFAIIGFSGAGKTSTSRMIAGLSSPTSGKVEVRIGDDWVDMSKQGYEGRGRATPYIGMLHQEYTLYPYDTVLQNLSTCIDVKMPAELAKMKAMQVLVSVGFEKKDLKHVLDAFPDSLSVGEQQRIAFAQTLIKEPRIVILDEPTGTMDPITKAVVAQSVVRARDTLGETFVVVSHDMDFIRNCCDRAIFMKNGKIIAVGKPDDIIDEFDTDIEEEQARVAMETQGQKQ